MRTKRTITVGGATRMVALATALLASSGALALTDAGLPYPYPSVSRVVVGESNVLPPNGVVQIHYNDGVHEAGLPVNLVVKVEALTPTPTPVPGRLVRNPTVEYLLWWVPDMPYLEGATYRITVSEDLSEPPIELAQGTFSVGGEPYDEPALPSPLEWCFAAGSRYECLHPDPETGTCSVLDYVGPEERVRLEIPGPDVGRLGRVGRWTERRAFGDERWGPFRPEAGTVRLVAQTTDVEPCIDLRTVAIGGTVVDQARHCSDEPLARCADVVWPKEVAPHLLRDAAVSGRDPSGDLDAGIADAEGGSGAIARSHREGCQASPGAPAAPWAAGLFALLLGLPRRRRRA